MTQGTGYFRKWISVLALALFAVSMQAQTINEVIESFNAAAEQVNEGNFEEAIAGFEATIEQATALGAEGDEMKARAEGQIPALHYRIAMDKYKARDLEGAIASFEDAVAASDKYGNDDIRERSLRYIPQLYNAVGNAQVGNGNFDAALSSFDKALEYKPDYARAIYGKAMVYRGQDQDEEMIRTLEKAAEVATATGDEKTVTAANKILKDHFVNNGKLHIQAEEWEEAINDLENSLKYDDTDPEPYYLICVIHGKNEEYEKAVEYGEKALQYEVDDESKQARIYYELGNAYMSLVEYDKACEAYSHALVEPYLNTVRYRMENVLNCE